jgi:rod shape-determining protein MreC
LLIAVVLLCLVLLTVQVQGRAGALTDALALVTTPAQIVLAKAHRGALALWTGYVDWKSVRREAAELRAENERLRVEALRVHETDRENERLRRLLALRDRLPLRTLAGEVIGREGGGWARAVIVNRGRGDGVESQTPVIVVDGLVGRVVRVRPGASVVQLLNDPSSSVGALVHRTRAVGLVEGAPAGGMRFKFMAREGAGIVPGDLIVTSGHGNVFPKGLPVGRVMAIEDRGSALFHYAILAPMADFARLEDVLLLTGKTSQDLVVAFNPGG